MDYQAMVSLIVALIMGVLFLTNRFPFGLVTITCCAVLVVTRVLSVEEAFSGFANQTVIMTSAMMVLGEALSKTRSVSAIKKL